jgi:hypothetical protein
MAGFVIAVVAFFIPFGLMLTRLTRPGRLLVLGGVLAAGWLVTLAASRAQQGDGHELVPLWFLAGLVVLLYTIWCGGVMLGARLRRARDRKTA